MRKTTILGLAALGLLALSAIMTALDAVKDAGAYLLSGPLSDFIDRLSMVAMMFAAAWVVLRLSSLRERTDHLEGAVARAADEGRDWRRQSRRFVEGLSRSIESQFADWRLTAAEADVAGLLLKGASLREIAGLRRTSEATIRQQAQNVYRKSGLCTRSELSAYFLEDLFAFGEAFQSGLPPDDRRYDA